MKSRIVSIILILVLCIALFGNVYGLGNNPPQAPTNPSITEVLLSQLSHNAGSEATVRITVSTENISDTPNKKQVTAQLYESDGINTVTGVDSVNEDIENNGAVLDLLIPSTIGAGNYTIIVKIDELGLTDNSSEYVINQGAEAEIKTVTPDITSHTTGSSQDVNIDITTANVSNNPSVDATFELINEDGNSVSGMDAISETIVDNTATGIITIPSTVPAGNYKIKITVDTVTDSSTSYTIHSQSNDPLITSVTLDSSSVNNGEEKEIGITVKTSNVADNAEVTATLYNSNDTAVNTVDVATGNVNATTGSTVLGLTLPDTLDTGEYYIKIEISSESLTDETATINVVEPDIVISGISTSNATLIKNYISGTIEITGSNFSTTASSNTISIINNDTNIETATINPSTASATSLVFSVPANLETGTYKIKVTVGAKSATSSSTFDVVDVSIDEITLSKSSQDIETAGSIDITVNTSNIPDNTQIIAKLYDSTNTEVSGVSTVSSTISSNSMVISFSLPATLDLGQYYIKVNIDAYSLSKNSGNINIVQPDVQITNTDVSGATLIEGNISGGISLTGAGFSSTKENNDVDILDSDDNNVGSAEVTSSTSTALSFSVPTDLSEGTYKAKVTVRGESGFSTDFQVTANQNNQNPPGGGGGGAPVIMPPPVLIVTIPPVPQNLDASVEEDGIKITWGYSIFASEYKLFKAEDIDGAFVVVYNGNSREYKDSSVDEGKTYYYEVLALNHLGDSNFSDVLTVVNEMPGGTNIEGVVNSETIILKINEADTKPECIKLNTIKNENGNDEIRFNAGALEEIVANEVDINLVADGVELTIKNKVFENLLDKDIKISINDIDIETMNSIIKNKDSENDTINSLEGTFKEIKIYTVNEETETEVTDLGGELDIEIEVGEDNILSKNVYKMAIYYYDELFNKWIRLKSSFNKVNGTVAASVDHLTKFAIMEIDISFDDIEEGHWAKEYIEILAVKGITKGVGNNKFAPKGELTRAQLATFIVRALDIPAVEFNYTFSDVDKGEWYSQSIEAAAKIGMVNGYPDGTFKPDRLVTREEMAVMIIRAYCYLEEISISEIESEKKVLYADDTKISSWAKESVYKARALEFITGFSGNMFSAKGISIREHMAVALVRMLIEAGEI
jgi:methionine-rich copper-binding protein CopC